MKLTNKKGVEIPMIGLGTFPFQGRVMADMVFNASKIGYRLFDTADDYRGEFGIGLAVSEHLVPSVLQEKTCFFRLKFLTIMLMLMNH